MTTRERIERDGLKAFAEEQVRLSSRAGTGGLQEFWQDIADHLRGKVLVDKAELRQWVEFVTDDWDCDTCQASAKCPRPRDCRVALLAHFGLEDK